MSGATSEGAVRPVRLTALVLGGFALVAQTLLFRQFLAVFEGHALAIAAFFTTWLLWVGLGATASRRVPCPVAIPFPWWPLLLPAVFVLQQYLLLQTRSWAGVTLYELFPLGRMLGMALPANAPVPLLAGWLLPWTARMGAAAGSGYTVGTVYRYEALGSVIGGIAVTLLLLAGWAMESVFLAAAIAVSVVLACAVPARRAWLPGLTALLAVGLLASGAGRDRTRDRDRAAWSRLMPAETFAGRFVTPHTRYLYGEYGGQFTVMGWQNVCEIFPNRDEAAPQAAMLLAQHPRADRILVVGPGALSLCRELLADSSRTVTWLHPDPSYPSRLLDLLPPGAFPERTRLRTEAVDVRRHLRGAAGAYDLIVLHLPEPESLEESRFFTVECLREAARALQTDGLLALRTTGGENVMGLEVALLGAALQRSLAEIFAYRAIKPGEDTWFFASQRPGPTGDIDVLQQRYRSVANPPAGVPPEYLAALFESSRIAFQQQRYQQVAQTVPDGMLLQDDRHPRVLLYSLLLTLRRGGGPAAFRHVATLRRRFAPAAVLALAAWMLFALGARVRRLPRTGSPSPGSGSLLVASTGFAGMALTLVLFYIYQGRFGSLFLLVGLLTALFMAGLFLGGWMIQHMQQSGTDSGANGPEERRTGALAFGLLAAHAVFCGLIYLWFHAWPQAAFAAAFLAAGILGGAYLPLAAAQREGMEPAERISTRLNRADHLGGAVGGALTGLVLVPLFGVPATLGVIAAVLALNLPVVTPLPFHSLALPARRRLGVLLWTAGGLSAAAACCLALLGPGPALASQAAENPGVQVLDSRDFAPEVRGYGGPIRLRLTVGPAGRLQDVEVLKHHETPGYMERVERWLDSLSGLDLAKTGAVRQVDAVSGATDSSAAILQILEKAGEAWRSAEAGAGKAPDSLPAAETGIRQSDDGEAPPRGRPRPVDWQALEQKWRQGELSEHEALYYSPVEK